MINISGFNVSKHHSSNRIIDIQIKDEILEKLLEKFSRFDLTAIEYKPFTRFTIAKYLDDLSDNQLSKLLNKILNDRKSGCFVIQPENLNSKIDDIFLVKLSTAVANIIGNPNHDDMA